jgi:hypothetical protein
MVHFNNSYCTRVTDSRKQHKKDRIVNLTDIGRHNTMQARLVRNLEDDGTYKMRQLDWDGSLIPEANYEDPNSINAAGGKHETGLPLFIAHEDKGSSYPEPYQPPHPEPVYEEHLESTRATVHSSVTYYPKSGVTTNKRSMTHDEIADQRGYVTR